MRSLRRIALVLPVALTALACSPPAAREEPTATAAAQVVAADPAIETAVRAVIMPVLARAFGKPLSFEVASMQTAGDWAWAVVDPRAPDGAAFDFTGTPFESAMVNGVLGDNGRSYFLLRRDASGWVVREHTIGPTDVAWVDWPQKHGAPAAVMGLE